MESPEYKTFYQCISGLTDAIKPNIVYLNYELLASGLITQDDHDQLKNPKESLDSRVFTLLSLVSVKVFEDKRNYHTFVGILRKEHAYHDIVQTLNRTYKLQGNYTYSEFK